MLRLNNEVRSGRGLVRGSMPNTSQVAQPFQSHEADEEGAASQAMRDTVTRGAQYVGAYQDRGSAQDVALSLSSDSCRVEC